MIRLMLTGLLIAVVTSEAAACSCLPPGARDAARRASAAYVGRVTSFGATRPGRYGPWRVARLLVIQSVKAARSGDTVSVEFPAENSCGVDFRIGREFLVYARPNPEIDGALATDYCAGTKPISCAAGDLNELGAPVPLGAANCDFRVKPRPARPVASPRSQETSTVRITRWATATDSITPHMQRKVFDLPGASAEGGELTLYSGNDSLRKVVAVYFGETGKATECYYVQGGALRFFTHREVRYDRSLSGRVLSTVHDTVWFVGDSAVQWRDTLGRVITKGRAVRARGTNVQRDWRNLLGLVGQASPSRSATSHARCAS